MTSPQCQEYKGQESKLFPKREECLSAFLKKTVSIHEKTVFLLQCYLFLYDQWLLSAASSEQVWTEANIGLASCRKRTGQSQAFPCRCLGSSALLSVCLLSLSIMGSPVEIVRNKGKWKIEAEGEFFFFKLSFCWFDLCFHVWVQLHLRQN